MWWSVIFFSFQLLLVKASESEAPKGPIIGIDLGTTYSCVGIFQNGHVEIIQNDQGNRITPSYVAFTSDGERLVGDSAKNQLTLNPENTIFDVKRIIGLSWSKDTVQSDIKHFPFKVINRNDRPYIEVIVDGVKKEFAPEEISAMVLSKMRDFAELYLGKTVVDAVITVPAYFNDAQKQSTKDAGAIAGLNVVRLINEPTAAALAFGTDVKDENEVNIVVFDLGGGTFDVTVLTVTSGVFEVISTNGDTHLGGEDFDNRLIQYMIDQMKDAKRKFNEKDNRAVQRLRRECEKAKKTLSKVPEVTIELELEDGFYSKVITRPTFERINDDLFRKTLGPLKRALEDSDLGIKDIHQVVLVGGSTRIPQVKKLVQEFFNGKEPNLGVNPDEAVAYGAAIQGGIISGESETSDLVLVDIVPISMGIMVKGGIVKKIIERNTRIPTERSEIFTTTMDRQPTVSIEVYQGERTMAADNHLLGKFDLTGLPEMPRGQPQIEVTFTIDHNGLTHVSAVEKSSNRANRITITNDQHHLRQEDIARMISDAEKYAEEDQKAADRVRTASEFESHLYNIKQQLKDEKGLAGKLTDEEKETLETAVNENISWLEKNPSVSIDELKQQKSEFEKLTSPILSKYVGSGPSFTPPSGGTPSEGQDSDHEEL